MGAYEFGGCTGPEDAPFKRADPNSDGSRNISDSVFVLRYLFMAGAEPTCLDSADMDDNGQIELTDAIFLFNFLFMRGETPSDPFRECGQDISWMYLAQNGKGLVNKVYDIDPQQDEHIAQLKLETMGIEIDKLTEEQKAYLTDYSAGT